MSKISIKINLDELRKLFDERCNLLNNMAIRNFPHSFDRVCSNIYYGFYVGYFGMGSKSLKQRYDVCSLSRQMDFNLLKYYTQALEIFINDIDTKIIDINDSYLEASYERGYNIGKTMKKEFVSLTNLKPLAYFDKIIKDNTKMVGEGSTIIRVVNDTLIYNELYNQLGMITSYDFNMEVLTDIDKKMKDEIASLMYKKFNRIDGFGSIINKLYRGFYGMGAEDIINTLKENNIKVKSVYRSLDINQRRYYTAMLKVLYNELNKNTQNSESLIRIKAYTIGELAKYEFIKEKDEKPIDNLIKIHKVGLLPDVEQISFYENDNVRKRV